MGDTTPIHRHSIKHPHHSTPLTPESSSPEASRSLNFSNILSTFKQQVHTPFFKQCEKVTLILSGTGVLANLGSIPGASVKAAYDVGWGLLHTSLCPAVSPVVPQAVCYPTLLATSYLSGFRPVMLSATEAGAAVAIVSCSLATASLAYRSYIEKKAGFVSKLDMKKEVLLARTQTVKRVRKRVSLDPAATDGVAKRLTFFSPNLNRDSTPVPDSIRRVTNCTSSKKATFVPKELTLSTTPVSSHISGHLHERSESPL